MDQQAKFEGCALVELFGHGHEAGYVTTQYYGDKAIFQVDVPEITLNCSDEPMRVGKKAAGALLDGKEWKQFPEGRG